MPVVLTGHLQSYICSHSVAVAELNDALAAFITWFNQCDSQPNVTTLAMTGLPRGRGRKGGVPKRTRQRARGKEKVQREKEIPRPVFQGSSSVVSQAGNVVQMSGLAGNVVQMSGLNNIKVTRNVTHFTTAAPVIVHASKNANLSAGSPSPAPVMTPLSVVAGALNTTIPVQHGPTPVQRTTATPVTTPVQRTTATPVTTPVQRTTATPVTTPV